MFDIIIILSPLLFFAGLMFVGYRRIKRRSNVQTTKSVVNNLPEPEEPIVLHGHDLAKWNYLGYTRCSYVDEDGNTTSEYPIFLFVSKNDMKRRSYYISSEYAEKNHSYMNRNVKPWAAGEGEVYQLISGKGNKPSDFLNEYMLDTFSAEWDSDTHWWGSSDKAKYNSANNKQKRERKTKPKTETKPESNVVTVEFGKQA